MTTKEKEAMESKGRQTVDSHPTKVKLEHL